MKHLASFFGLLALVACGQKNVNQNTAANAESDTISETIPAEEYVDMSNMKPRLVVMTDIGPGEVEPDDMESAVRLMAYADRFEIEVICTTIGWNCDPYPEDWALYLDTVIAAYEHDVVNLMKRSGQSQFMTIEEENGMQTLGYWPSAQYIRSRSMMGSRRAGIAVIGEGNDSPGSDMLIKLASEKDPRPIWIASWGGSNTLAQAIWRVKQTATPEELKAFVRKFRVYTITDQDMHYSMRMNRAYSSHQWMRKEFADDLLFIWDESAWLNQCELGKKNWEEYASRIQSLGKLGEVYPNYLWGVEGDTPSFLHLMPNGLNDPDEPTQVGWGGYHVKAMSPDSLTMAWTNFHQPVKGISNAYEHKFYPDEFNDFAARMQWANDGMGDMNPTIVINGDSTLAPVHIKVASGSSFTVDASDSFDFDGDNLMFSWWIQPEAGTIANLDIKGDKLPKPQITVPQVEGKQTAHLICEVHDNGPFNLVAYRRVIIDIE